MYPKASEVIRWAADHLDITDKLVAQVAEAQGVELPDRAPTDAAQRDLRAIADELEGGFPVADMQCGRRCDEWDAANDVHNHL